MRRYFLVFLLVAFQNTVFAQFLMQKKELSCRFLNPIEKSFFKNHINPPQSKEFETRFVKMFIKKLDPAKLYLVKEDLNQIERLLNKISEKIKNGQCDNIEKAYALYKKRVIERTQYALEKIKNPNFKFLDKTQLILDPDKRNYASTLKEANLFHDKYIQFQISNDLSSTTTLSEAKEKLIKNYTRNEKRVQEFDLVDLYSLYLDAVAHSFDPHSSYLSADFFEDFKINMSLELEGIGATLSSEDGFTTVQELVKGGAADLSEKVKPKDIILAVGEGIQKANEKAVFEDVVDMDLKDVVKKIRGKAGTTVRLKIKRGDKVFETQLVRAKVNLENEAAQVHYIKKMVEGIEKTVALVELPSFYGSKNRSSADDMKKLFKELSSKKVDGVVLDLSSNGGGVLVDAVKIAGLFLRTGNIVAQSTKEGVHPEMVLKDEDPAVDYSGPLVVLISRMSASASEIVSGALKDYGRAVVVGGDHTFGKGTVQTVQDLDSELGAIKTTVGMFFVAGGHSTQHRGVSADIVLPSLFSSEDIGEKLLDYSLSPKTIPPFLSQDAFVSSGEGAWSKIEPSTLKVLSSLSKARVAQSKKFDEIRDSIKKAEKRKNKPLVLSELMKEKEKAKDSEKNTCLQEAQALSDQELKMIAINDCKDPDRILSAEEKKTKYLKRADIVESVDIVLDLAHLQSKKKEN